MSKPLCKVSKLYAVEAFFDNVDKSGMIALFFGAITILFATATFGVLVDSM